MNAEQRIEALEGEIKLLKNEIKAILLDIREHYLDYQNPFTHGALPSVGGDAIPVAEAPAQPLRARPDQKPHETEAGSDSIKPPLPSNDAEEKRSLPASPQDRVERAVCSPVANRHGEDSLGLSTIAGLTKWVEETVALMGREKLEALVDVCCMSGRLPPHVKDAILVLVRPYAAEHVSKRITGKQYLLILSRLDGVLGNGVHDSAFLSSMMFIDRKPAKPRERVSGNGHKSEEGAESQLVGSNR